MANALFLSSRLVDRATLVASSQVSSLPVAFLQDQRPEKKLRFTGCTAEWVAFDLGADIAEACNALFWIDHNQTALGKLRLRMAATADAVTSAPVVDTGEAGTSAWPTSGKHTDLEWPQEISLLSWANDVILRYGRLDIADPTNPAGFVQAARFMIGRAFRPTFNIGSNFGLGLSTSDKRERTAFNRLYTDNRGPAARRMILPLSALKDTELKRQLFQLQRYCGLARDFGFALDPDATDDFHINTMQATFENDAQFDAQPIWDANGRVWRTSLSISEPL